MIIYTKGDILQSNAQWLINTINCVGVMGKGIALAFKNKYPDMYLAYRERCSQGLIIPGHVWLYPLPHDKAIINFPTKRHWRDKSYLYDIKLGLDSLRQHILKFQVKDIAIPPLGCGNGSLNWNDVKPLIIQSLNNLPQDFYIYEP